jgi:hypothetical protein
MPAPARFAFVRVPDACASLSDDSLPHFAAEKPDEAATMATIERTTASAIASQPGWSRLCFRMLADLLANLGRRQPLRHASCRRSEPGLAPTLEQPLPEEA